MKKACLTSLEEASLPVGGSGGRWHESGLHLECVEKRRVEYGRTSDFKGSCVGGEFLNY